MAPEVRPVLTEEEVSRTYPVMKQLRPHLTSEGYTETVRRMRASDGYCLAAVVEDGEVRGVAGYRIAEFLAHGKILYVDDLVTDGGARSTGLGRLMLDWLIEEARKSGCRQLQLDSGVQRHGAHRFYFREGMKISSYHFSRDVDR